VINTLSPVSAIAGCSGAFQLRQNRFHESDGSEPAV
jgi:hypothetical protein